MKKLSIIFALFYLVIGVTGATAQQPESEGDKTLSPYFFVKSDDPNVDQLPLKETSADVSIAGVIADVKVTQVYKNEGKSTLEAIYIFPASTRASVYGMKMTIGERTIIAKIQEREKARQEYEQAKQQGKSASLLEQHRPNVFQMNVANILPGDEINVELSYTELLIPENGIYEFVYPTVVGPRYSNQPAASAPASEKWVENPYLHQGEKPSYSFDISVHLSGSMPIQDVICNTHKTDVKYSGLSVAEIKLDPSDKTGGNKDYILKYRLTGGKIESGLMLYSGEKENFFLLMLQPPERVTNANIPPREYIFIVDVSGSMYGFPLDISKGLMKNLIQGLRPTDKFNVLLFSGGSQLLSETSLPATSENVAKAIQLIEQQRGGGGTELLPALQRALALKGTENYSRSMVIVTDGYVGVEKEAFDLIRNTLGNANFFSFGIGSSVNRFLIEGMARVGMGEPFIITKPDEAAKEAEKFREYIQYPVLTRAKVDFDKFDVYDVEPPGIPDLLAERPVILFGKWRGTPKGKIKLNGISGENQYTASVDVGKVKPLEINSALRYLWARHKIALLADYNKLYPDDSRVKEVTRLGLEYNLLTEYTSFVAIDSLVRRKDGDVTTVKQPLPLPEGVSDYAVGNGMAKSMAAAPPSMSLRGAANESMAEQKVMAKPSPQPVLSEKREEHADKKDKTMPVKGNVVNTPEKLKITKNLSKQDVEQIIAPHIGELEKCYQTALLNNPGLKGEAVLRIVIDSNGKVKSVVLTSSDFTNEDLKECIIKIVKQWQFNATTDGKDGIVEYYLIFKP